MLGFWEKMNKEIKSVAVHNGKFHSDDVFSVAILKIIFPDIKIIRTHDEKILKEADLRVDVGKKYNPLSGDFDHHQKSFNEKRKNGIPYSSVGLIWKNFGMKLVNSEKNWKIIDKKIIQPIDALDNGMEIFEVTKIQPYCLRDIVDCFNFIGNEEDSDKSFYEILEFAMEVLRREIAVTEETIKAEKIILDKIASTDKDYIVLEKFIPWKKVVIENSNLKFVIFQEEKDNWIACAVPVELRGFESRKPFPKSWAGLEKEELQKITGVKDAKFCHKNLFIVVAGSKKGVIKLVELGLK